MSVIITDKRSVAVPNKKAEPKAEPKKTTRSRKKAE